MMWDQKASRALSQVLLAVWLCAIIARLGWAGLERRELSPSWPILFAPFDPIFQTGWIRWVLGLAVLAIRRKRRITACVGAGLPASTTISLAF